MNLFVKIHGMYAPALTCFFLETGDHVVNPPQIVEARFKNHPQIVRSAAPDIMISDLDSRFGVRIVGDAEKVIGTFEKIRGTFFDVPCNMVPKADRLCMDVIFPCSAKLLLDDFRNNAKPTLRRHHQFKSEGFDEWLEKIESEDLARNPEKRNALSEKVHQERVWETYAPGRTLFMHHLKPDGKMVTLRPGEIVSVDTEKHTLTLKRCGFKGPGRYDGLSAPIMPEDYAMTILSEGDWFLQHTYYRKNGEIIGRYFNVNTPAECFPDGIRYLDLEVDVIQREGSSRKVIDKDKIELHRANHVLSEKAVETALKTAEMLVEKDAFP